MPLDLSTSVEHACNDSWSFQVQNGLRCGLDLQALSMEQLQRIQEVLSRCPATLMLELFIL